ncbi:hypothetical protein [Solitalea canadensis]|uniref:Uncharacterized protein n=1 Tax=Solitalea canadensis (strain ATCC 29591 / DSM 3403 / JCM 21819 / LMG 8368 / NBRC 15130 / NCIMB 12057 / USAM 9D) TaxID=929556 RepID=H8KQ96_SOLCM|nr:hypothetical protein [Solitalea canadensis]AFD06391.1 hypothetical protein Solca_1302 [Solitalea canadensis DSM 3403]
MDSLKEFLPFLVFAAIAIIKGISEANKNKKSEAPKKQVNQQPQQPQRQTWSVPAGQNERKQTTGSPYEKVGPSPAKKSPFEILMEEFMEIKPQPEQSEPQYKRNYQEPRYEKPVVKVETNETKPAKVIASDLKNVEQLPEEVVKARAAHAKHGHGYERIGMFQEEHEHEVEFDLRDAVIKSVILERYSS